MFEKDTSWVGLGGCWPSGLPRPSAVPKVLRSKRDRSLRLGFRVQGVKKLK